MWNLAAFIGIDGVLLLSKAFFVIAIFPIIACGLVKKNALRFVFLSISCAFFFGSCVLYWAFVQICLSV